MELKLYKRLEKKTVYGTGTVSSPVLSSHSIGESGLVGCARTPDLKMTIYNSTDGALWTNAADESVINVTNYPMLFVGYYDAHWVVGIGRNSLGTKGTVMTSPTTIVDRKSVV